MRLNQFAAERRLAILEDLKAGLAPREGRYDEHLLREARTKGVPQAGSTVYSPGAIVLEFIYPDPQGAPIVLAVHLPSPERIVYLPVPEWVIESIWQGEVSGSHQFESDAYRMLDQFRASLEPEQNLVLFGERMAIGKA